MAKKITGLSTKAGKTDLFNAQNPNKLWKLISVDMEAIDISRLSTTLKEVDEMIKKEDLKVEVAFNRVLKKKSEGSDELFKKFKSIKTKRCFFK